MALQTSRGAKINDDKEIIELVLSTQQIISDTVKTIVAFDTISNQAGNKLAFENNSVKIGTGVSLVKISYTLWIQNNSGYSSHHIMLNGNDVTYNIDPVKYLDGWHTATATKLVTVQEGDVINLAVRFAVANETGNKLSVYAGSNRMIVEVIK